MFCMSPTKSIVSSIKLVSLKSKTTSDCVLFITLYKESNT